jgi:hypothetical protein
MKPDTSIFEGNLPKCNKCGNYVTSMEYHIQLGCNTVTVNDNVIGYTVEEIEIY